MPHHKSRPDVYYDAKGRQHKRGVRFSKDRHHHRKHHRRGGWQKILGIILLVLVIVAAVLFAGWRIVDAMGKRALYNNNASEVTVPTLAEADITQDQEITEEEAETWKPGWVRYNGSVYEYNSNILTFLFMGIDSEDTVSAAVDGISGGQADALFLLIMNPDTKDMSILAINRNTMAEIDVYDRNGDFVETGIAQICLQHGYGDGMEESCERQVSAVSKLLYNLPISGYAAINMGAIEQLNDAVGGVEVKVLETISWSGVYLEEGTTVTLQGRDAFAYCKYRNQYEDGTADKRLERQKQYLSKFGEQLKNQVISNPTSIVDIYNQLSAYTVTDLDLTEVTYLAGQAGNYRFNSDIYSMEGETHLASETGTGFEEFEVDQEALYDQMINLFYKKVK